MPVCLLQETSRFNGRHYANRRKVRPTSASHLAAEKISVMTESKKAYYDYEAKMAIKREQHELFLQEHAKRMQLLDLQQQFVKQKLQKFEE